MVSDISPSRGTIAGVVARPKFLLTLFVAAGCLAGACSPGADDEVLVFVASSLSQPLTELATHYENETGTRVRVATGSSAALREQILDGAPAAVFVSASEEIMDTVADDGLVVGEATPLAANHLVLAVAVGNPLGVEGVNDLARESLRIGACTPKAPCGSLAEAVQTSLGWRFSIDGREANAAALRTKISVGEYDAALLYATDARTEAATVEVVDSPELSSSLTIYPVARMVGAGESASAEAFVDWILRPENRARLETYGFTNPSER